MKNMKKLLSLFLVLAMALTLLPTAALATVAGDTAAPTAPEAAEAGETGGASASRPNMMGALKENLPAMSADASSDGVLVTKIDKPQGLDLRQAAKELEPVEDTNQRYADEDLVRVFVMLEGDDSLLDQGFTTDEIADNTAAVKRASTKIARQQNAVVDGMNAAARTYAASKVAEGEAQTFAVPQVQVRYNYSVAVNALSVEIPYGMLKNVRTLKGVKSAFVAPQYSVPENMSADRTAEPYMYATQNTFGSAQTWQELGYTGAGMKIAIIDTGLDLDHPSFVGDPKLTEDSMTQEDLTDTVISGLKAKQMYRTLTAEDLYHSPKVPFGFNYVDENVDVTHDNDTAGDHGTHVAGIAAANKLETTDVVGVAPDAQLVVMKVFGANGGAYMDDIVAALEDCFVLDVDAANLSLGSPAGFNASDAEDGEAAELSDRVYGQIASHDMIVSIAAGNSGSAAAGNPLGTDLDFTSNPDNSTMSSPATYPGATVVASVDNVTEKFPYIQVGDKKLPYTDQNKTYNNSTFVDAFAGETLEYVMVPGLGEVSDFEQVDVEGKVAVVSRGTIAFTEKHQNATDAGAIACIVYDNAPGALSNMQGQTGTVPSIFVSQASGEALAAGNGRLTVPGDGSLVVEEYATGGQISSFSSWGVSPNLELTPDVTAPGGQIYSSVDDGGYDTYGGTSMAAPHIAGMSALVLEYLKAEHAEDAAAAVKAHKVDTVEAWYHNVAQALIMSTATPAVDPYGTLYSPRWQGSGVANVYHAISSPAYLTVADNGSDTEEAPTEDTPKVSLGDDKGKNGEYTFTFTINNFSDQPQSYTLDGSLQTEFAYPVSGYNFMMESGYELSGTVEFDQVLFPRSDIQYFLDQVNYGLAENLSESELAALAAPADVFDTADVQVLYAGGSILTVPAGSSVDVEVTATLSGDDKKYMDANFPNGIYVDGYVRCYALDEGGVDLSLPFMSFYGDWTEPPLFDTGWYYQEDGDAVVSRYVNVLWTDMGANDGLLGISPYLENEVYDSAHNVLSPNGDQVYDYINEIYLGMMRNAEKIDFEWTKETDEGTESLFKKTATQVRKSYLVSEIGVDYPFIYSDYLGDDNFFTSDDMLAAGVQNGDRLTLTITGYGVKSLNDTSTEDVAKDVNVITVPVVIDTEAPTAAITKLKEEGDESRYLKITVKDNYDAAALFTLTGTGDIIESFPVEGTLSDSGETKTFFLDLEGYEGSFQVAVCDYGGNESYYQVAYPGNVSLDPTQFYAYRRSATLSAKDPQTGATAYQRTDAYNGWHSFETADSLLRRSYAGDSLLSAAEYVDGYIIAVDDDKVLYTMKAGSWTRNVLSATALADYPAILDMAFDRVNKKLYLLTDQADDAPQGKILTLDPVTGEVVADSAVAVTGLREIENAETHQLITLACDNAGQLYALDFYNIYKDWRYSNGIANLYKVADNGVVTYVGSTGETMRNNRGAGYFQSMAVDHATDTLYWASYGGSTSGYNPPIVNKFFALDKATGAVTAETETELSSELVGLFKPAADVGAFPADAALTSIAVTPAKERLLPGDQTLLEVQAQPYYVDPGAVTWTSSNQDVATVDAGVVTAVSAGTTIITASAGGEEATATITVLGLEAQLHSFSIAKMSWMNFAAKDPAKATVMRDAQAAPGVNTYFTAAAYADGDVYAYDSVGGFWKLDPETMQGSRVGSNSSINGSSSLINAMVFSPADGSLYAVYTKAEGFFGMTISLVKVNPANGAFETVGLLPADGYSVTNLAVDADGNLYSVVLTYDVETRTEVPALLKFTLDDLVTEEPGGEIGPIGPMEPLADGDTPAGPTLRTLTNFEGAISGNGFESLTWSYDDGCLYFSDAAGILHWIEPTSAECLALAFIGAGGENFSIHEVTKKHAPTVSYAEVENVLLPETMLVPMDFAVPAGLSFEPWNSRPYSVSYGVDGTDVATVDDKGIITGVGEGTATLTVTVQKTETGTAETKTMTLKVVDADVTLGGYVVSTFAYAGCYWISFNSLDPSSTDQDKLTVTDSVSDTSTGETSWLILAGAYYKGDFYAYAQDYSGEYDYKFYMIKATPGSLDSTYMKLAQVNGNMRDMAFDYTTGTLYAVMDDGTERSTLCQVDTTTGELTPVYTSQTFLNNLAIDDQGVIWSVAKGGKLVKLTLANGQYTLTEVGDTGITQADTCQSLHYDYKTDNIFWAQAAKDTSNGLYLVDRETGSTTRLGAITTGISLAGLYTADAAATEPAVPETVEATGVSLPAKETVLMGETLELTATVLPISVADVTGELTWSSSDPTVATVDENGVVTPVATGPANIIATLADTDISAQCQVTVMDHIPMFYAYDETQLQWISFPMDDPSDVTVVKSEKPVADEQEPAPAAEGEVTPPEGEEPAQAPAPIVAAALIDDALYAYDAENSFYKITDFETFDRGEAMIGAREMTVTISLDGEEIPVPVRVSDLSYDAETKVLYALCLNDEDNFAAIGTVNLDTGAITACWNNMESGSYRMPGNLYVKDGQAWMVDAMETGMLCYLSSIENTAVPTRVALIQDYFGDCFNGRSLIEDPYTGTIYMIRDLYEDWSNHEYYEPMLYTITLGDGNITPVGENNVIYGEVPEWDDPDQIPGVVISSLFIR